MFLMLGIAAMSCSIMADDHARSSYRYLCGGFGLKDVEYAADGKSAILKNVGPNGETAVLATMQSQPGESGFHFVGARLEVRGTSRENVEMKLDPRRDFVKCTLAPAQK